MKSTDSIFKTMRYHGAPLAFNSLDQRFIITACMASLHLPPLSSLLIFLSIFPSATTGRTNFGLGNHDNHRTQKEFSIHSHAAIEDWNSNPTSHSSLGTFLVHPLWVGASVSFSIGFALGILVFLLWHRTDLPLWHRTIKRRIVKPYPDKEPSAKPTLFSQIIRSIDDLSFLFDETTPPLQVIGRGACGEVYKAELLTGEQIISVAIKKIPQPSLMDASRLCKEESKLLDDRMRQIKSEIVTVGRMRHPHLVHLLAHVPKPEYHYLVYEYMPNGSLHDAIKNDEGRKKLSWPNRLKIAQGVAAGLEYLHMVHRPRIIHRDLKPANILLDENLNARIADFGMAKVVREAIGEAISSANVVGTLGYIAPEYYQTLHCTDKCDIYSFGVILAVLVTGIFPSDRFFQVSDEPSLVAWVRSMASSEESNEAIDPFLMGTGSEAEMILVLKIACFCTYDDPKARPNSKEVLRMLSQISRDQVEPSWSSVRL